MPCGQRADLCAASGATVCSDRARTSVFASIAQHSDSLSEHPNGEYASTYRWIVAHLVQHDSYHGGQAVLLHETWKKLSASSY